MAQLKSQLAATHQRIDRATELTPAYSSPSDGMNFSGDSGLRDFQLESRIHRLEQGLNFLESQQMFDGR